MGRFALALAAFLITPFQANAVDLPIRIVAAQTVYGEIAAAIGGGRVTVQSIATNPNVDPHDFEPSPSVARSVADAQIVIHNGADYDQWMEKLLGASAKPDRTVIDIAALLGAEEDANPHIWYDPSTIPAAAEAIAETLAALDPDGAEGYRTRQGDYLASFAPLSAKVAAIIKRFAGTPITASEPVFGPMADALGLVMTNEEYQAAIMREAEPSARQIAQLIDDLRTHKVKALILNSQVVDNMTAQLVDVAEEANVPVVGVSETLPVGSNYVDWMLGQLEALDQALAEPSS